MIARWFARFVVRVVNEMAFMDAEEGTTVVLGMETEIAMPFGFGPGTEVALDQD